MPSGVQSSCARHSASARAAAGRPRVRTFVHIEVARLEELRTAAREELIDAELELGHHAKLIGELEGLVTENPLRERLRGQLMLALYRSGRQAKHSRRTGAHERLSSTSSVSIRRQSSSGSSSPSCVTTPSSTSPRLRSPPSSRPANDARRLPSCSPTSWTRRASRRLSIRRFYGRSCGGTSTRSGPSSSATAARSRSSWATPRWPFSECRRRTRKTHFGRFVRRVTFARR